MRKRLIGLVVMVSCGVQAAPVVLQGTLGGQKVVLEMQVGPQGEVDGRYFVPGAWHDVALGGRVRADGSVMLVRNPEDAVAADAVPDWVLKPVAGGGWQGAGSRLAVMAPVRPVRDADPYDNARLAGLSLEKDGVQDFMGHRLVWWREPVSQIRFFRVDKTFTPLNRALEAAQWQAVSGHFSCALGGRRHGYDYRVTVTPRLMTATLFSASVFTAYDCGGAHPDAGDAPLNLAVKDARPLTLKDVLPGATPAWIAGEMARRYPQHMLPDGPDGCDYRSADVWRDPVWYLLPSGLYLGPGFARYARACEYPDWPVLPWQALPRRPVRRGA